MRQRLKDETLWLPERLLQLMLREAARRYPRETGGVWMGYRVEESRETVVTHVIGPGPDAWFGMDAFRPDAAYQHAEIDRVYQESGRKDTFLGDWHTHPRSTPYLSAKDRAAIREIATDPKSRQPNPIMAILAGGDPWRLVAWRYRKTGLFRLECAPMILRRW